LFLRYEIAVPEKRIAVRWEQRRASGPCPPVRMGKEVAMSPLDSEFGRASLWHIGLSGSPLSGVEDVFLKIEYVGDIGRILSGGRLLTDDFYKGTDWEIGLKRLDGGALATGLDLEVLPLCREAPIYIEKNLRPALPPGRKEAIVKRIVAVPEYEVEVTFASFRSVSNRAEP
jgi:hypothetical protein